MMQHPIVKSFLENSRTFKEAVSQFYDPNNFIENLMYRLVLFREGKSSLSDTKILDELLCEIDKGIMIGHADTSVYMLFLSLSFSIISNKFIDLYLYKGNSFLSIWENLITPTTDKVLVVLFLQAKVYFYRVQSKLDEAEKYMAEIDSLLEYNDLRFEKVISNYCSYYVTFGRPIESNTVRKRIVNLFKESQTIEILRLLLCDKFLCGQIEESVKVFNELVLQYLFLKETDIPKDLEYFKCIYGMHSSDEASMSSMIGVINAMRAGLVKEAEASYTELVKGIDPLRGSFMIDRYITIQLAFLKKDKSQIQFLLKEQFPYHHFLDDLFYGRFYLLLKKYSQAYDTFENLIKNTKKYNAFGRLAFELQFAKELDLFFALKLMRGEVVRSEVKVVPKTRTVLPRNLLKGVDIILGNSNSIDHVKELIKKYAKIEASILVTGETGTGKELVARAIHQEGKFSSEPFLAINCGALTENLMQSELFGYVAGAFTGAQKEHKGIFEAAGRGTVFLDEFGEINATLQIALLRVLETREIRQLGGTVSKKIHCKIVVATNVDLKKVVREKRFREDLYFRLVRFELQLPPLRDRKEDIPLLIQNFLDKNIEEGDAPKKLSSDLLVELIRYDWPGNIRELKNEIDRLYILCPEETIIPIEKFDFSRLQIEPDKIAHLNKNSLNKKEPNNSEENKKGTIPILVTKGEQRLEQIKVFFDQHKRLSRNQIIIATDASPATITKDLKILCDQKYIKKVMPTTSKRTHYFVKVEA